MSFISIAMVKKKFVEEKYEREKGPAISYKDVQGRPLSIDHEPKETFKNHGL